jgi:hypothetical protein
MSEVNKIVRFVGIEACKSIFSDKSTFVLRSPEHYIRWCETNEGETDKGDRNEGSANTTDGGTGENKDWVISCWTILEKDKPTSDEWNIFKKDDQNIVAIISTPSKVCKFLEKTFETDMKQTKRKFPFNSVEHGKVIYGKPIDPAKIIDAVPFNKDVQFKKQKEYRFVLECYFPNIIDSLIFCRGIDYMEQCFVNPKMRREQKEELKPIILYPGDGYGDFKDKQMDKIIANFNDLY